MPYRGLLRAGACAVVLAGFAADDAGAAFSARVEAGTLRITGDAASDRLALRLEAGAPGTLVVDAGAAELRFDRATFAAIAVDAGSGDDDVQVDESAGTFTDEAIRLAGDGGDDALRGGSGADELLGGDGNDFADGNGGDDEVVPGGGDDRIVWDAASDGNDVVKDEGGDETLEVNGSNANDPLSLADNGKGMRITRGFVGAATTLDAAGVEDIVLALRGGIDIVRVLDLNTSRVRSVDVDLGGPDNVNDTVIVGDTGFSDAVTAGSVGKGGIVFTGLPWQVRVLNADETRDNVTFQASGGDDRVTTGAGLVGPRQLTVDGGPGDDTVTYRGTRTGDTISVEASGGRVRATAAATMTQEAVVEHFVVEGLDGADALTAGEGLGGVTELTLDGGTGDDLLAGGDGGDLLLGGSGNDAADGNGGDDDVRLGTGNDRVSWDAGDGSDRATGELGADVLDVNGTAAADELDFSANGPGVRVIRTDATTTIDLDDVERAAVSALGGTDAVVVNDLGGTDLKTVDADLGGADGQRDVVLQRGTERPDRVAVTRSAAQVLSTGLAAQLRITGTEPANDELRIFTLAGDDTITVAADVRTLIATFADLGPDD